MTTNQASRPDHTLIDHVHMSDWKNAGHPWKVILVKADRYCIIKGSDGDRVTLTEGVLADRKDPFKQIPFSEVSDLIIDRFDNDWMQPRGFTKGKPTVEIQIPDVKTPCLKNLEVVIINYDTPCSGSGEIIPSGSNGLYDTTGTDMYSLEYIEKLKAVLDSERVTLTYAAVCDFTGLKIEACQDAHFLTEGSYGYFPSILVAHLSFVEKLKENN